MRRIMTIIIMIMLTVQIANAKGVLWVGSSSFTNKVENGSENSKQSFVIGIGLENRLMHTPGYVFHYDHALFSIINHEFSHNQKRYYYKFYKLQADVMFKYKFKKKLSPYIMGGGMLDLIAAIKTNTLWKPLTGNLSEGKTLINYGVVFGAGIDLDFYDFSFSIEGRYRLGLANLKLDPMTFKTQEIALMLGIKLK